MIEIVADAEALALRTAELFTATAQRATKTQGVFRVALSGGGTPRRCYELLAASPFLEQIPWSTVEIFWGDERCVPRDDPRSNAHMTREALLSQVPLAAEQIHPLYEAGDPAAAAQNYERLLGDFFGKNEPGFDLVLLGLGEDGHTASLFPGSPAREEKERWVRVTQRPGEEIFRLTLTLPILNRAAQVIFLVAGASKTAILHQVLAGNEVDPPLPAQLIRPQPGELLWLVDRAAAGDLSSSPIEEIVLK